MIEPRDTLPRPHIYKWDDPYGALRLDFSPAFTGNQHKMCSFVVKGKLYMVGGEDNTHDRSGMNHMQQAWSIEDCRNGIRVQTFQSQWITLNHHSSFRREPDLPFIFDSGRCTSMKSGTEAMLCSGIQRPRMCYTYDLDFENLAFDRCNLTISGWNDKIHKNFWTLLIFCWR